MKPLRAIFKTAFAMGLKLNATLTRSRLRGVETRLLTPLFVRLTRLIRGRRAVAPEAAAIGAEWERLLAARRLAQVTRVAPAEGDRPATAFGQITVHCPLRGTGDVAACHRLMAYDRGLVEGVGGQLIVLASQATPGREHCVVAIRRRGDAVDDLVPAHRANE